MPPDTAASRVGSPRGFIDSYVFPDGELHEVGSVVSPSNERGFEVRHVESLREHYPLTLRAWLANLEANWDAAVAMIGEPASRVWRLYIAPSEGTLRRQRGPVPQVLTVKPDGGTSGMPLRPVFTSP